MSRPQLTRRFRTISTRYADGRTSSDFSRIASTGSRRQVYKKKSGRNTDEPAAPTHLLRRTYNRGKLKQFPPDQSFFSCFAFRLIRSCVPCERGTPSNLPVGASCVVLALRHLYSQSTGHPLEGWLMAETQGAFFQECPHLHKIVVPEKRGPHSAKLVCKHCGKFFQWVPSAENLQQRKENTEILTAMSKLELPAWERQFVRTLGAQRNISPKQQKKLLELRDTYLKGNA